MKKKFRPLSLKSSNAQTIFGRRQLRSSAAFLALLTKKITVSVGPSYSLEEALRDELRRMAPRFTTSPENAPMTPTECATLWYVDSQSSQDLENGLLMFSRECSGPH